MKIATSCPCCGSTQILRSPAVLMPFVASRVFGWEPIVVTADLGLRDLQPGHAYSVCNSLGCADCEFIFLDMRFDDAEMGALYEDYRGSRYCAERDRFEPGYAARNASLNGGYTHIGAVEARLEPYLPARPRVLDWGGDTGINTPFRGRAAVHDIFDISGKPPVAGARLVTQDEVGAGTYDLIVCGQVIEHVPDPRALLQPVVALMSPATLLYIELPHEALMRDELAFDERLARKRHWHEHINFYSRRSLGELLASLGLRAIDLTSHAIDVSGSTAHIFSILARKAG